jgi:hypothetical protein
MEIWIFIGYLIASIFLLVSITFYLYYYSQNFDCQADPNPWCWNDWTCADGSKPAQALYGCIPGQTRNENYCTPCVNGGPDGCYTGDPPRGCQCMPDPTTGIFPTACKFSWNNPAMASCTTPLRNTRNGHRPNIGNCNNLTN